MTNNTKTAIAPIDVSGTQIERYGQRAVVRELMSRLLMLHPAASDVGESGMLAVAQLAVLVGANPLPSTNEIHVWMDPRKGVTVDLGINYFRRRGNELGGIYWAEEPRIMTDAEYDTFGLDPKGQIGAICRGARLDKIRELVQMGIPFEGALKGLVRTGVGTVSRGDYPKKGRPLAWTALKACEKDLCRALFPNLEQPRNDWLDVVPQEPSDAAWEGYTIEGMSPGEVEALARAEEAGARGKARWDAMNEDERQERAAHASQVLYGDPDFAGFDWPEKVVEAGEDNGDRVQVADAPSPEPQEPPATNPKALLKVVNGRVEVPFDSLPHLRRVLCDAFGDTWNWPNANDGEGWLQAYNVAIADRKAQTGDDGGEAPF